MDRSEFPHLNDSQWESVRKMGGIFGLDMLHGLVNQSPAEQVDHIAAFDTYERGLIAHIQGNLQVLAAIPREVAPKPLRLKVPSFDGKEGENLHFWVREVEIAMGAAPISNEQLRVAFALSNLGGRAKSWAYTRETMSPGCFASWPQLAEQLRATFLPANIEYRQRSRFLSCKRGKRELHEYVQEMRILTASMVGDPLPEDIKVTVFMDGLKVGTACTQLFRVQASALEQAINIALQEEYSHTQAQARTPIVAPQANDGAVPMDLSLAEQREIRCFGCGKLGHMKRACPRMGQGAKGSQKQQGFKGSKGRWSKPGPKGQGNSSSQ